MPLRIAQLADVHPQQACDNIAAFVSGEIDGRAEDSLAGGISEVQLLFEFELRMVAAGHFLRDALVVNAEVHPAGELD